MEDIFVSLATLIWSLFPAAMLVRLFVVRKGGRERDPGTGQYRSGLFVKFVSLFAAIFSYYITEPIISSIFNDQSSKVPFFAPISLLLGILMYFLILK